MKRKQLVVTVMWFITSILWFIMFFHDIYHRVAMRLAILRYLCAILSFLNGMLRLVEYTELE